MTTETRNHRTNTLPPQQAKFVAEYLTNGGNGTEAALAAGYSHANARFQASRLLAQANIGQQIAQRQATLAVQSDYTIATWRQDLLEDIARAREAGSHSAVMKGREILGRHIGALSDHRVLDPAEARWFSAFETAMRQAYGASQLPAGEQPVTLEARVSDASS